MITIYTDGASKGNPGPGGWGVIVDDGGSIKELGGRVEHTTNNRMELTAAIEALKYVFETEHLAKQSEITINTDSEYVMKGMTEWIAGWQARGWRTAAKKPVLNQDLWQELLEVSKDKDVEWKYVPGHSGVHYNEMADRVATEFAEGLSPVLYDGPKSQYQ